MANHQISGPTIGSSYHATTFDPVIPCTIVSTRPGVIHRRSWNNPTPPGVTPNVDNNNLDVTYAWRDSFGLPTLASNNAPNTDDYVAGATTTNQGATRAYQCDVWLVMPVGVNSVRFGGSPLGNCAIGLYAGKSFRYAQRIAWNVGNFQSGDINLSRFTVLCGQRIVACRLYAVNGYLNGGYNLTWSLDNGVSFVNVPAANCHGEQPSRSSWPN